MGKTKSPVVEKTAKARKDTIACGKMRALTQSAYESKGSTMNMPTNGTHMYCQKYGWSKLPAESVSTADKLEDVLMRFPRSRLLFKRDNWTFTVWLSTVKKPITVKCGLKDYTWQCGSWSQNVGTAVECRLVVEDLDKFGYLLFN